jgi:hypothetical protein
MQLLKTCNKGKAMNCWESFYMQVLQKQNLLIDEQKTNESIPLLSSQHNETIRHTTRHPLQLSTRQTSTVATTTKRVSPSLKKYIQHFHNIISAYPYNNIHIYCRFYMQPQTHTDCTRDLISKRFYSILL